MNDLDLRLEVSRSILHRGTCHVISRMRNDDLALCLWAHDVWGTLSRNPLEIETWVQWNTNRKWHIGIHNPDIFGANYLENGWRFGLGANGALIRNAYLGIK